MRTSAAQALGVFTQIWLILGKTLVPQHGVLPCTSLTLHNIPPLSLPESPIFANPYHLRQRLPRHASSARCG